jgi:hypothetical protein
MIFKSSSTMEDLLDHMEGGGRDDDEELCTTSPSPVEFDSNNKPDEMDCAVEEGEIEGN